MYRTSSYDAAFIEPFECFLAKPFSPISAHHLASLPFITFRKGVFDILFNVLFFFCFFGRLRSLGGC